MYNNIYDKKIVRSQKFSLLTKNDTYLYAGLVERESVTKAFILNRTKMN